MLYKILDKLFNLIFSKRIKKFKEILKKYNLLETQDHEHVDRATIIGVYEDKNFIPMFVDQMVFAYVTNDAKATIATYEPDLRHPFRKVRIATNYKIKIKNLIEDHFPSLKHQGCSESRIAAILRCSYDEVKVPLNKAEPYIQRVTAELEKEMTEIKKEYLKRKIQHIGSKEYEEKDSED